MDLNLYIAELLLRHNAVNVPNLGTFYKDQISGYYDRENAFFYPPMPGLHLKVKEDNDTVLTDYICQQKNVSPSTALYFIEKFVSYTKTLIDLNGQATINSVGTLSKTSDGYSFTSNINLDDDSSYFGLVPVKELVENLKDTYGIIAQPSSEPIKDLLKPEPAELITEASTIKAEEEQETQEEVSEEEAAEESNSKLSTSGIVLLLTGFLIVAGIISYLTFPEAFKSFNQNTGIPKQKVPVKKQVVAAVPMSLEDSLNQADTIYQELSKQGFEIEKPRDTLQVTTEIKTATSPTDAASYEIIGAAFARRNEAETYVNQLQKRGMYAKIVENMPGSKLKISLGTFNDEVSASKELVRIKADINKDAWIARIKPKKTN